MIAPSSEPDATRSSLRGRKQIERSVVINAPKPAVWAVLADSRLLPQWVPAVAAVTDCSIDGEAVGTTRTCQANLGGKSGKMVERCVEFSPTDRIAFLVDDETFGMRRMFDDYGFALTLADRGARSTLVTLETHYTPKNAMYSAMNRLMMRRQFTKVCDGIVNGLKTYLEHTAEPA